MQEHLDVRAALEGQIEHLIDLLDIIDGDPDLEPYLAGIDGAGDDREGPDSDLELSGDENEPSLGSLGGTAPFHLGTMANWTSQTRWSHGGDADCELDDSDREPNGDEDDGPDPDREPSLGSTNPHEDLGQTTWVSGNPCGCDEEQGVPSGFVRVRRELAAEHHATLEASRRLREILARMSGVAEKGENLRPVCIVGYDGHFYNVSAIAS